MPVSKPILYIIVPCYNEELVLPITSELFLAELKKLIAKGMVNGNSRILFVNDGSKDNTWNIIRDLSADDDHFTGICLSCNQGHQNAVLAGLMEAKDICDLTISIDCDGQDDVSAMEDMVREYLNSYDIVYGVRSDRKSDTWFKRKTAEGYYKLLNAMGTRIVYNHADYRLVSSKVLQHFADFHEVNIFLRGMFPLIGFKSTSVYYSRKERVAGESHYPLRKMLSLAFDGITSFSIKPIKLISGWGCIVSLFGLAGIIWAIIRAVSGHTVAGWASIICVICFLGGMQMICLGVIGEYVGKIYMETKRRPRYIISERTSENDVRGR